MIGKELRWPALVIQGIILGNIAIIAQNKDSAVNSYLFISSLLILSLFILQCISRRFLLLYPINTFMVEPVPSIDTYMLRIFIFLSVISFFSGLACNSAQEHLLICRIENFLMSIIIWIAIFFLVVIPAFWMSCLRCCSKKIVVNRLKNSKNFIYGKCKKCGGYAVIENKVISQHDGQQIYNCEKCGKYIEDIKFNIAY